jgi:hypothetical protein
MQLARSTDPYRVGVVGAVVFRGDADTVDWVFNELRSRYGIEVFYVRSDAGRLRIVEEGRL